GDGGIMGECSCPAHQKTKQHCKHIASLLITVRNEARAKAPRAPAQPPAPAPAPALDSKSSRRRERRRRSAQQTLVAPPGVTVPNPDASASPTGIGAWLPPEGAVKRLNLEFRLNARQGGLTV